MKKLSCLLIFLFCSNVGFSQDFDSLELEAYFTAIIVNDIEASIDWYTSILGFEVINRFSSEERGFKQSNLDRNGILIELIELNQAVNPEDVIPNYTNKTRLIGLYKAGFQVQAFENWASHLEKSEVEFYGNTVINPISGKKMLIILDPDGNRIQIFEK